MKDSRFVHVDGDGDQEAGRALQLDSGHSTNRSITLIVIAHPSSRDSDSHSGGVRDNNNWGTVGRLGNNNNRNDGNR